MRKQKPQLVAAHLAFESAIIALFLVFIVLSFRSLPYSDAVIIGLLMLVFGAGLVLVTQQKIKIQERSWQYFLGAVLFGVTAILMLRGMGISGLIAGITLAAFTLIVTVYADSFFSSSTKKESR